MGSAGWTVPGVPADSVAAPAGGPVFGTDLGPAVLRDLGLAGPLAATDAGDLEVRITGPERDAVSGELHVDEVLDQFQRSPAGHQPALPQLLIGQPPVLRAITDR